ncbi:MAG: glycosyltransferase family 2 protein [Alicyclobacillus sp.]|nr:glycosyltransferase family 2 protein [Alicyclobacillus sp.]
MISVVLLTYNSRRVLPDCIRSLEACTSAQDLEVVIVDNGSTDGTKPWVDAYLRSSHPFVGVKALYLEKNYGFAYGNNRGLEQTRGDLLLLLNPDTVVGRDAIAVCAARLSANRRVGAVGCRLELPGGVLDKACKRSFPTLWNSFGRFSGLARCFPRSRWLAAYNLTYLDEYGSYPVDCVCGAFMMVRREVYERVGGLDEDYFMYGEDIDWCYRIREAGYTVWYEGTVTTVHLKGGNGGKRSSASVRHFYDTMYLYYTKTRGRGCSLIGASVLKGLLRLMYHVHVVVTRVPPDTAPNREAERDK